MLKIPLRINAAPDTFREGIYERIVSHRAYLVFLSGIFFAIVIGYFITWPVMAGDTDLWYHLSGGRYLWQNGSIARDAFFSYIEPQKVWYNYYWLFQAIVYPIHAYTGYYGLIVLRCILYSGTVFFVFSFFIKPNSDRKGMLLCLSFFVLYPISLTYRELLVRPHLFSYFFIIIFLYILERKREKAWLLPILGILWCNIHGIEFPVMFLILLAYLAESYYEKRGKTSLDSGGSKKIKRLLIGTLYTVFLTPHITDLVKALFTITYDNALHQHLYVSELIPLNLKAIFVFSLFPISNLAGSFQHFLIIASFCSVIICLFKRNVRLSHLIIFIASVFLLKKHNRFVYEFLLLNIPLVRHGLQSVIKPSENKKSALYQAAPAIMFLIMVAVPLLAYGSQLKNRPVFPFSRTKLPAGVVQYLNNLGIGGRIMNEPDTGGYLPWALDKKYRTYMDMELSLFRDNDFAFINHAFDNENAFRLFIKKYDPDFISVSRYRSNFKEVVSKYKEFRLVFFDDREALYVNTRRLPGVGENQEIKEIDPFHCQEIKYASETKERLSNMLAEAMPLKKLYPEGYMVNAIIANILNANNQHEKALPYADSIIRYSPEVPTGYALRADALLGMGRAHEAAAHYQKAISRGVITDTLNVYRNLAVCYVKTGNYKKAYALLSRVINPFNVKTDYKDIYELAMSAASSGKIKAAQDFLRIAEVKLPPDDAEYTKKISDAVISLGLSGGATPGMN